MISLIICSTTTEIDQILKKNIQETIGVEYEIISIDNSQNKYSIFEAYNLGVSKSKYEFCCFMHQDIWYHTADWGKNIIEHFNNNKIGLIGVAGSRYIGRIPRFWSFNFKFNEINIIQSDNSHKSETQKVFFSGEQRKVSSVKVSIVDGVWFCIRKGLFQLIRFDESFKGFHFYDLDICMQINSIGYENHVIFNSLIEHFSVGSVNKNWIHSAFKFHKKWWRELPYYTQQVHKKERNNIECEAYRDIIKQTDYLKVNNYFFDIFSYLRYFPLIQSITLLYNYKNYFYRSFKKSFRVRKILNLFIDQ